MHVMQTPSLVGSHLHMPIARLQQHIIMPFIMAQQLHMPPAIIEQRFCSIVADIASSHLHVIFIPPVHFSILILHRGTIIHCGADGMPDVVPMGPSLRGPSRAFPSPLVPSQSRWSSWLCPQSVCQSLFRPRDFPVISSSDWSALSLSQLNFNIKCHQYFDAAKIFRTAD